MSETIWTRMGRRGEYVNQRATVPGKGIWTSFECRGSQETLERIAVNGYVQIERPCYSGADRLAIVRLAAAMAKAQ